VVISESDAGYPITLSAAFNGMEFEANYPEELPGLVREVLLRTAA
jgi:hypothetical protein